MFLDKVKKIYGFTLVELVIVVLIIATLAGISVPTYFTLSQRAREIATKAEMRNIATGLELYSTIHNGYPLTGEGLPLLSSSGVMGEVPDSDEWEMPYAYSSDGEDYELRSSGVDTTLNTSDDIVFENGVMTGMGKYLNAGVGEDPLYESSFADLSGINLWYGDWTTQDGVLSPSIDWAYHRVYFDDSQGTDYKIVSNATIHEGMGYGIYYRLEPGEDFNSYVFQYDPGLGNKFVVRKVVAGLETPPLAQADMPEGFDVFDTSHEVEITVSGDNHVVLIDGEEYLSFTDDQFSEGYVGYRTWHASDVSFEDISIEDLSE